MTSHVVSRIIMWVVWYSLGLGAVLMAQFLTRTVPRLNSFDRSFEVFAIGMFLFPILICGAFRFWLSRIRNPWLALLPFCLGVFFAWYAGLFGIFLLPEFCIVFQVLSFSLFLVYMPLFVRLREEKQPPALAHRLGE